MLQHPAHAPNSICSSLRLGITGGAVVPATLIRRMREDLGFAGVVNGYGLTECGGYGTMCSADDTDEQIANTAGKPFRGTEVPHHGRRTGACCPSASAARWSCAATW